MTRSAKNWVFTINNYTNDDKQRLANLFEGVDPGNPSGHVQYVVYGEEVGEQGTPHLQGYVSFVTRRTFNYVKNTVGSSAHLEVAKGTPSQNRDYCTKDGAFTEFGVVPSGPGARSDIRALTAAIQAGTTRREIFEQFPTQYLRYSRSINNLINEYRPQRDKDKPPTVVVLWGETGTGKSKWVWEQHPAEDIWVSGGDEWFDGYDGQPVALFDDFRGNQLPLARILNITDRYPTRVKIKGGFVNWTPQTIYFTSNVDPRYWYQGGNLLSQAALLRRLRIIIQFPLEE